MIEPGDEIILFGDGGHVHVESLDARSSIDTRVRRACWCDRPQREIRHNGRGDKWVVARCRVRHINTSRSGLVLPEALVGSKNKCLVLDDRPSSGTPKLNPPKWSDGRTVKIIPRIEDA